MHTAKVFMIDAGWRTLLKDMGIAAANVMRLAGLPEDALYQPHTGLNTADYFRFWQALEQTAAHPLFALQLVGALTAEVFSPPLFAALCSPNMHAASQRLAQYKQLIAPMALDLHTDASGALTLQPRWLATEEAAPASAVTQNAPLSMVITELAFLLRLARLGTREPIQAMRIALPALPQPLADYESHFGAPITRSATPSITFCAADAQRPFLTANDALWHVFEPALRQRLSALEHAASVSERVRALLLECLPSGQASMDTLARRLAMSKRTLQRRLEAEGQSFQQLVSHTRQALARHYLTQTQLTNHEISFLLGFEDPNSFFRAFQDWTGHTPQGLRQGGAAGWGH